MPTHEEIIAACEKRLERELEEGLQSAMDSIFEILESANYVVHDNDEDYERADEFVGFLLKRLYANGECPDPFAAK